MSTTDLKARIGAHIKARRIQLGLSQRELCRRAGLGSSFLIYIEKGEQSLTVPNLVAIGAVLGRSLDWFVKEDIQQRRTENR